MKSPTLYRLAADRRYSAIPDRVKESPEDLLWTDRFGSTALHLLCQSRTVDRSLLAAVDAIVQAEPELVSWSNAALWTPLHFAVEKQVIWGGDSLSTELILRLIQACPSAVSLRMRTGFIFKTPFHLACEADADYRVLKAMLTVQPSLAAEPYVKADMYSESENPIQLLWRAYQRNPLANRKRTEQKIQLLLQAAHCRSAAKNSNFRLLNAACSIRCPQEYFQQVLSENRDKVAELDYCGLTPLHYAVQAASPDSQAYTQTVIEALVKECPSAAAVKATTTGRLPLHIAVSDSLLTWHKGGLQTLTMAYTNALRQVDPLSGLVPFLASSETANRTRLHFSTTYELLRTAPEMVQVLRKNKVEVNSRFELLEGL